MEKRTPADWTRYLSSEDAPVTITEYMAGCLSRILGCLTESTAAVRHVEGMVGAMDAALENSMLSAGKPYPSSAVVREALDAHRRKALK